MIKVLIVDDHPIVRHGLKQLLEQTAEIMVGGEATDGDDALSMVRAEHWDAVILDISMPSRGGLDVLQDLVGQFPDLPVIILSMHAEAAFAARMLRMGASAYVTKDGAPSELLVAIRLALAGRKFVSPALAQQLALNNVSDDPVQHHEKLSDREFQVMVLIARGVKPQEIAQSLSLSVKTINTYRARVLTKLGISSNAEVTHYAVKHKLID